MDWVDAVSKLIGLIAIVASGFASAVAILVKREVKRLAVETSSQAATEQIVEMQKKIDDLDRQGERRRADIAVLQREIGALPTIAQLHQIDINIAEMRGELHTMAARFQGLDDLVARLDGVVTRHESHLLNKSGRAP